MGKETGIAWTGSTWTPIRARNKETGKVGWHCTKPSPGCKNCYAESLNMRLGTGLRFVPDANVEIFLDRKMLDAPTGWRKPRRIFVCSMTDLFGEFVPTEMLDEVFAVMTTVREHTYQVLTKRPDWLRVYQERRARIAREAGLRLLPAPNIHYGVSVENQAATSRIDVLRHVPAAVRFLSVEPMLERIDLKLAHDDGDGQCSRCGLEWENEPAHECPPGFGGRIHWVIVGGESGPGARQCDVGWIRDVVAQCKVAGVACFVKQLGAQATTACMRGRCGDDGRCDNEFLELKDRKGANPAEWPDDLRIQEFPT